MPAYDPISIPDFVFETYQDKIKTIKNFLTEVFPEHAIVCEYSIELSAVGFKLSDYTGDNAVFFKSMFLKYFEKPLETWLLSSGIKEFISMNSNTTLVVDKKGRLLLQQN